MKNEMPTLRSIVKEEVRKMLIEASDLDESIELHSSRVADFVCRRLETANIQVISK